MVTDWQGTLKLIDALRDRGATSIKVDGVEVVFPARIEPPTLAELEKAEKDRKAEEEATLHWSAG